MSQLVSVGCLKLTEADQELYRNFPLVVSERWQLEVAETVLEVTNTEADRLEQKRKCKPGKIDDVDLGTLLTHHHHRCLPSHAHTTSVSTIPCGVLSVCTRTGVQGLRLLFCFEDRPDFIHKVSAEESVLIRR